METEARRLVLEIVAYLAAVVEIVPDARFGIDADLWQWVILQSQTTSGRNCKRSLLIVCSMPSVFDSNLGLNFDPHGYRAELIKLMDKEP